MARLQDFQSVTPSSSDNLLIVQPTGQGLAPFGSTIGNKAPKSDLAGPSITGSTNNTGSTISAGTFFYLNGSLVRAKSNIANGATLTANTNYETITAGGLNKLNDDYDNLNGTVTTVTADGITWTVVKQGRLYDMYAVIPVSTSNPITWGSLYVYRSSPFIYGLPIALTKKLVDLSYGTGSVALLQGLYTDLGSNYNLTTAADVFRTTPTGASSIDVHKYIRGYV